MTQKLKEWLSERTITEVECLVPDIAGIPRGKILPAEKYHKVLQGSGLRLPEYVFGQTVTGDYHDSVVLNAAVAAATAVIGSIPRSPLLFVLFIIKKGYVNFKFAYPYKGETK